MKPVLVALLLSVGLVVSTEVPASLSAWQPLQKAGRARSSEPSSAMFRADLVVLAEQLGRVPHHALQDFSTEILLPMPDGSVARFSIVESPIMETGNSFELPEFRSYKVFGIADPSASGRIDLSPRGFFGLLHTATGRVLIDPERVLDADSLYMARRQDVMPRGQTFSCGVHDFNFARMNAQNSARREAERVPGMLQEYRLAVAATREYVAAVGPAGKVGNAQNAIATAINRVNQIFERDLGITLKLVKDNRNLIEKSGNVSFTNEDPYELFFENQCWIDRTIGENKYDIGHVFNTGASGLAMIGSVCDVDDKGKGVTGRSSPLGDPFYIDYVAHEIGHQFGAEHSFNGTTGSCGSNRSADSAVEPGSGSTIMGYAGICSGENLQSNSDATFHANSINEINAFVKSASCGSLVATIPANNNDPVLGAISNYTIPSNTPFVLSGSALDADADGDTLLYQWDQMDMGAATRAADFGTDSGKNPLFRSYEPSLTGKTRDFPALGTQVTGLYDKAEALPCDSRKMNFRLTARDGKSGQDFEKVRVTVTSKGPFAVKDPNVAQTIVSNSGPVNLKWEVASTDGGPVNCSSVDIDLLTFAPGYVTYSVHNLLAGTPNDGSEPVNIVPLTDSHPQARFRVSCSNNIFYDISDGDLDIVGTSVAPQVFFDEDDNTTFFNNNGTTSGTAPACKNPGVAKDSGFVESGVTMTFASNEPTPVRDFSANRLARAKDDNIRHLPASCDSVDLSASGGGSGAFDIWWLLLLGGLAAAVRYRP
ncbi:MAG: hypothetical protein GY815_15305 [Gammaproteobacteria bacterium]|nr:hypothetical protein [Gammaproteobacteria bacterium]